MTTPPMPFRSPLPTRVGRYEPKALLGVGAMADVFLACDPVMGREVALKVLAPRFRGSAALVRRFEREARTMASVSHPNVVTIFEVDAGPLSPTPFIAMELAEGRTLRELLADGPLPAGSVAAIGSQIAAGLAAVHRAGVVHRDVKPENVMVSSQGFVKLLDFGLSKPLARPAASGDEREEDEDDPDIGDSLTAPGTILGTPQYMSPEQARGQRADFPADQFALGAILHEMTTGLSPFRRETFRDTLAAIDGTEIAGEEAFRALAPPALQRAVRRLLSKRPEDRYPTMQDVEAALSKLTSGAPASAAGRWALGAAHFADLVVGLFV